MQTNPLISGNKCGHNPSKLRFPTLPRQEKRPVTIQKALGALLRASLSKESFRKILGFINTRYRLRKYLESHCMMRSEGRESILSVSAYLFYNLEFLTMTVAKDDIRFIRPTHEDIAKAINISVTRVDEAIKVLIEVGLIYKEDVFYVTDRGYKRRSASIIHITPRFFMLLGIGSRYDFERNYKSKNSVIHQSLKGAIPNKKLRKGSAYKKTTHTKKKPQSQVLNDFLRLNPHLETYRDQLSSYSDERLLSFIRNTGPPNSS